MPRPILAPISSNSRSRSELSDERKSLIIRRYFEGAKVASIARAERVPNSTIRSLIRRYKNKGTTSNSKRSGRPPKVTIRTKRALVRAIRKDPKLTFKAPRKVTGVNLSKNTIKKALRDEGLIH